MFINVVTGNPSKFKEIENTLDNYGIDCEQKSLDIGETKNTIKGIVLQKACESYSQLKEPLIVDDTGIFFNALDNFPGPFPKRIYEDIGYGGLLDKLKGKNRDAYFLCLVCYKDNKNEKIFQGKLKGKITKKIHKKSKKGYVYDSIFVPEFSNKPLSEIPIENRMEGHRTKAVKKFAKWFSKKKE